MRGFWLILTYDCGNRCAHCYSEESGFRRKQISLANAQNIIKELSNQGATECSFIGGEPTLYDYIVELTEFATANNVAVQLLTNGVKLSDYHFTQQLWNAGLRKFCISICGPTADVHNTITKVHSFEKTVNGIKNCLNIVGKLYVSITVNTINLPVIEDSIEFLLSLGVKNIGINPALPQITGSNEIIPTPKEQANLLLRLHPYLQRDDLYLRFNPTIPYCLIDPIVLKSMRYLGMNCQCHAYEGNRPTIDFDGNILPCTHFIDMSIGNIYEVGLQNIYKFCDDPTAPPARLREKLCYYPSSKCKSCSYWGECIGGCPLYASHFDRSNYIGGAEWTHSNS